VLRDCDLKFGHVDQRITLGATRLFRWEGGSIASGSAAVTGLFVASTLANLEISGVDLSNAAQALNIFNTPVRGASIRNCKLPASWSGDVVTGTLVQRSRMTLHNCDSGDTNYRVLVKDLYGAQSQETVIVRTDGATDGTTPLSWRLVTTSSADSSIRRFESGEIVRWNETTGSAITATVEILHDSATALDDDEIWLEVMYLGTSGVPLGTWISDAAASVLATPAAQTASTVAWTTTGITDVNKQKLAVTFTPQEKGFIHARVVMGVASKTVYVDPKITVS
jgi:hypothetical protein